MPADPDDLLQDLDEVLCHADGERLRAFVEALETRIAIEVVKAPSLCLTMVRAEDSLEQQPFFLGEALMTECEVRIGQSLGIGLCLGEEPQRAYCIAVFDALREANRLDGHALDFIETEHKVLRRQQQEEVARILQTKVDFKLLEQE